MSDDLIGWGASAILLATLLREVWVQWRECSTEGVSAWLFLGQFAASVGFILYSWRVHNRVFVFTNSAILVTAVTGQLIFLRNRSRQARQPSR